MELVEKAGSGIKRIRRLAKKDNIRVEFKTGMFFEVVFYRKIRSKPEVNPKQIRSKSDKQAREKWILDYQIENEVIKTLDIMNQFSVAKDTAARDLRSLIKQNKIIRKGGGNNVWYVLKNEESKNEN